MRSACALICLLPLVCAAIPPLLVVQTVRMQAVDVPFWDQWELVPLLEKTSAHQLTWRDLWAQHNEHRLVLPRLAMLALARCTHWDLRAELGVILLLACAEFALLVALILRTVRPISPAWSALVLVVSLLVFTLAQTENWIWGWQLQIWFVTCAAVLCAWLVVRWDGGWRGVAWMLLASLAAVLSFANGLLLLCLLPAALLVRRGDHGRRRLGPPLVVGMVAAVAVVTYAIGYQRPAQIPAVPSSIWSRPLECARYTVTFLGAVLGAPDATAAGRWGTVGVLAFAACLAWLWTRWPDRREVLLPWILLAVYAVASGVVTAIGRLGYGVDQALAPRYVSISLLFWVAFSVLATLTMVELSSMHLGAVRGGVLAIGLAMVLVLASRGFAGAWIRGHEVIVWHAARLRRDRTCVLHYDQAPDSCFAELYPDPVLARQRSAYLASHGIGPFAPAH
jgi:hypothetical protein